MYKLISDYFDQIVALNDTELDVDSGGDPANNSAANSSSYWGGIGTAALGVAAAAAGVATAPLALAAVAFVDGAAAVYVGISQANQAMSEASS